MEPQEFDPNELVTLTSRKTKAVKRVKRSDLAGYGLPTNYQSQADIYAKSVQEGRVEVANIPEDYKGGVLQVLNESGFKPEDIVIRRGEETSRTAIKGLTDVLDQIKQGAKEVNMFNLLGSKAGISSAEQRFNQKKLLAGQFLAKLVEKNRLSDADRQFYQNKIMNISPIGFQKPKEEAIDDLKNTIITLSGFKPEEFGKKDQLPEYFKPL